MRLAGTLAELAVATPFEPDTLTVLVFAPTVSRQIQMLHAKAVVFWAMATVLAGRVAVTYLPVVAFQVRISGVPTAPPLVKSMLMMMSPAVRAPTKWPDGQPFES